MATPTLGRRQRQGVVDAVTHHRHRASLPHKRLDPLTLLVGQKLRGHFVHPELAVDGVSHLAAITREQNRANPHRTERTDRVRRLGANRISNLDDPEELLSPRHQHRRDTITSL